ncbi:dehydrodolichyl diphosphate synthase complex subunit DHDDS-like [Styela clava]
MSLILEDDRLELSWVQKLCLKVIRYGPIPKHVAFIMDGNRRFAAKKHVQRIEGHSKGFDKLAETLKWCQDLGVEEVTVYAFSAENFKRSKEEVDSLMELARQKFAKILEEKDQLEAHGVRVRIVGELNMLSLDLRQMAAKIQNMTKSHNKCRLNICVAYISRLEMTEATREIAWGVQMGFLLPSDVSQNLISQTLQIPAVDLLIRTSGEVRLSDFLLWQSTFSYLSFLKALWPEFSIWDFYGAILLYQNAYSHIKTASVQADASSTCQDLNGIQISKDASLQVQRINYFLEKLREKREIVNSNLSMEESVNC